jgi:lysophospholipase L1-like esterase
MFPVLLAQGFRTRKIALRLPDGEPPNEGQFGDGDITHQIIGLGDSVIAGVGVRSMAESLTASVAWHYHEKHKLPISWAAMGVNGERLTDLLTRLRHSPPPRGDLYLVSIGVNDVTRLTSLLRWQMQVVELISLLNRRGRVILLGVPPMEHFFALPQPLRWVLGLRAALLDRTLQQVAELAHNVVWIDSAMKFDAEHLAEDGYHPNSGACVEIAAEIVDAVPLVREEAID